MSQVRKGRSSRAGVSLLEMLIALAVMALIAFMATSSLETLIRIISRSQGIDESIRIALDRDELRGWIERAVDDHAAGQPHPAVAGDKSGLSIRAIIDDGFFWPGEGTNIEIAVQQEVEGARIVALARGVSDVDQRQVSRELVLSSKGGALSIRYFGRKAEDDSPRWHDAWEGADGLPDLITLAASDAAMTYPPLYISPGRTFRQREMSLSSLLPPALPSRP